MEPATLVVPRVTELLNVLAPAKAWVPVLTIPGFEASAGPKVIVVLLMEAPLVWELPENVPTVVTPLPPVPQLANVSCPIVVLSFCKQEPRLGAATGKSKLYAALLAPEAIVTLLLFPELLKASFPVTPLAPLLNPSTTWFALVSTVNSGWLDAFWTWKAVEEDACLNVVLVVLAVLPKVSEVALVLP